MESPPDGRSNGNQILGTREPAPPSMKVMSKRHSHVTSGVPSHTSHLLLSSKSGQTLLPIKNRVVCTITVTIEIGMSTSASRIAPGTSPASSSWRIKTRDSKQTSPHVTNDITTQYSPKEAILGHWKVSCLIASLTFPDVRSQSKSSDRRSLYHATYGGNAQARSAIKRGKASYSKRSEITRESTVRTSAKC